MIALSFHLWHGFQSAFQTLGLNHKKYTFLIENLGKIFSIIIPGLFAFIPFFFMFSNCKIIWN
jgi:succinate dehydrogenase / fumarate reductase cytochrome b subunit